MLSRIQRLAGAPKPVQSAGRVAEHLFTISRSDEDSPLWAPGPGRRTRWRPGPDDVPGISSVASAVGQLGPIR